MPIDFADQHIDLVVVECPYCGESVDLALERDVVGEMVVDCEVCCRPWHVHSERDANGRRVRVERDD